MGSLDNLISTETWAFSPAFQNSWISEPFHRDTESLTKALQNHIASGPETPSSKPETVSKRVTLRNAALGSGKITKRKSRASKRSPTTFITADPANFRQMVQQVTGQVPIGSLLKPVPKRPVGVVNRLQTGCLLPTTLDTSAFLLDHHQQVVGPAAASMVAQGSLGFGPPGLVAGVGGAGLDFDGLCSFPTLESWKVM